MNERREYYKNKFIENEKLIVFKIEQFNQLNCEYKQKANLEESQKAAKAKLEYENTHLQQNIQDLKKNWENDIQKHKKLVTEIRNKLTEQEKNFEENNKKFDDEKTEMQNQISILKSQGEKKIEEIKVIFYFKLAENLKLFQGCT